MFVDFIITSEEVVKDSIQSYIPREIYLRLYLGTEKKAHGVF